jgi:hypothetical protein
MILPSSPVAIAPASVAFKLVTRVVGVGKPSGPIDVDTEVMVGKIGVGRPSWPILVDVGTTGVDRPSGPAVKPPTAAWIDMITDANMGVGEPSVP